MFSLPFRKSRRKSEPTILEDNIDNNGNNSLSRINSITSTISNRSRKGKTRRKSHSHILSKKLSFFNNSSDELNSLAASNNSDNLNETVELSRFKSLNYDKFNKELLQYLKFHGLSAPRILNDSNFIRISMSSTGENVFLPSIVKFNEEDADNLDLDDNDGDDDDDNDDFEDPAGFGNSSSGMGNPGAETTDTSGRDSHSRRRSTIHQEDDSEPVTHTFAIIISLTKPTSISTITTQLQANTKILWPDGVPSDRSQKFESFEMGQLSWDLNLSNYNYYVPYSTEMEETLEEDSYGDVNFESYDTGKFITEARINPKFYREKSVDQIIRAPYNQYKNNSDPFIIGNLSNSGSISYPPGDYVFTLPVLFPPSISESLITQHASVSYIFRTIVAQKNKVYNFGEYPINVIRGPPSNAETTADKPVYVNKIWNDALSYEISFPKKYVTVGSNNPIKMKFQPLEKDISIRRIRVNVLEKTTYCSKNLNYEYDEASVMKLHEGQRKTNLNERIIPLLEIRSKSRTELALKEEILNGLLKDDNLLSSCYKSEATIRDDIEIIGQLQIQSHLPFIKPRKPNKELKAHGTLVNLVYHQTDSSKGKSQINKNLPTKVFNQGFKVDTSTFYNETPTGGSDGRGIYPGSINNRFIQLNHKLQIAIRLSKKDNLGKVHHYEVMIDTPVFFLNSACIPSNIDLPPYHLVMANSESYNNNNNNNNNNNDNPDQDSSQPLSFFGDDEIDDQLPTFEEAISPMNSPSLQPYTGTGEETNVLSRVSTIASTSGAQNPQQQQQQQQQQQNIDWDFDNIDQVVTGTSDLQIEEQQQIPRRRSAAATDIINNLKRTATVNSSRDRSTDSGLNRCSTNGDDIREFNNRNSQDQIQPPPKYSELMSLVPEPDSESSIESLSSLDDDEGVDPTHNESTDLTEQFNQSMFNR